MTALAGDCFAHGESRLSVRAALDLLRERTTPVVGSEELPLDGCFGRVLAEAVTAPRDVPGFDNVAVDGWAFAFIDSRAHELTVASGRAAAGHPAAAPLAAGQCLRVLTGAPMPQGADTVALQEEVAVDGGRATIPAGLKRGANRRRRGEDIAAGTVVLEPGSLLGPRQLGVAAEVGRARLAVFRPLRVALFSSGDEIVEPGRELPPGGVYDANRIILQAALAGLPVRTSDLGILPDHPDEVSEAIGRAAVDHDLLLASGGASRGDEDHVVRAVAARGRLDFWQIAMKPGRPLAFGRVADAAFIGLPGNPVAVLACFMMFARPALLRLAGGRWIEPRRFPVRSGFAADKRQGRTELIRCRLVGDGAGMVAERVSRQGSGVLTTMLEADGFVELGDDLPGVARGDVVPYLPFTELLHAMEPR